MLSGQIFTKRIPAALLFATLACASVAFTDDARAQQVVAHVNGEPITAVDVAQRMRFTQLSTHKPQSKQEALDELIDEQLKLQTARRYRIEIPDSEVDQILAGMAGRMRVNSEQFAKALASSGVSVSALKRKLRADIAWSNIVRGKFQSSFMLNDKDVTSALQTRGKVGKETSFEYTLRPILLIVQRGGADGAFEARRREAEGLRSRFQNCDDGMKVARGLQDVAIREPIVRTSGDLTAKLRELLDSTEVGRLTPPDITPQGIEVFALCGKREARGDTGAARDVREEMLGQRFAKQGKRYLQELRRSAMIQLH